MSGSLPTITAFTPGDIVVSISGDGNDSGSYTDNQASPITLEEINPAGTIVGILVLPQTTTTTGDGVTDYAVSGEYGSSSEGTLELSADGHSLVIAGYAVNAATYNAGGAAVYGNAAEAQSTSIQGGQFTAVARAIVDISANGTVDSSTALYNVFNTNNPRSVATVNGTTFYIAGQGVKGDTTQGVFVAQDGAGKATALNSADDAHTVEIYNNQLYVSQDSKQPSSGGTSNISTVGTGLPTATSSETVLPGISQTVTLSAGQGNSVNASSGTVHLSPENFFFANATTLYVADGGNPKQGGLGDGGLQKWSLVGGTWTLDYTLSAGLGLVSAASKENTGTGVGGSGGLNDSTGLIGLTGLVSGNTVTLFATNSTLGDLDQTYLYRISDSLGATTMPTNVSFTTVLTAAADSNIRGVAFAPTPACYCHGTLIRTAVGDVAVEALAIGDQVITLDGRAEPIRWIGRRSYNGRSLAGRSHLLPVVFRAGSLGAGVPERDLRVSPMHAMYLEGVLVPAWLLVNGTTIVRETDAARVDYVHVELAQHDVIWAEGAPAETFLDDDSRFIFQNARDYEALYPNDAATAGRFYAPRVEDGYELEAIRASLEAICV
jgi:hypothetical protein